MIRMWRTFFFFLAASLLAALVVLADVLRLSCALPLGPWPLGSPPD